jgi:hypothetical protein
VSTLPSFSVIVEWDTGADAGRERAVDGLARLSRQIAAVEGESRAAPETIVCFDPREVSEAAVRTALAEATGGRDWPGVLHVAAAPEGLDYYEKKNYGFRFSTNEIAVFLDSDLLTEASWLRALVGEFSDFRHSVVVGRTHFETRTLYERAVALFWIFDTRDPSTTVRRTDRLVSNNVAVRRALFARLPFPVRPTYRGQCSELAGMLAERRIALYEQPAARACHPAPAGVRAFVSRAFHAGNDQHFYDRLSGDATWDRGARQWLTDLDNVGKRLRRRGPEIGAGWMSVALARVLGLAYYSIKAGAYGWRVVVPARRDACGDPWAAN